jgi:hypothetical protein
MVRQRWIAAAFGVGAASLLVAGCSSAPVDCGAPYADVPATVAAGESVTLTVDNLYPECQAEAQRLGEVVALGKVTVTLQTDDGETVASTTESVDKDDGKATVVLEIPATASGPYQVMADESLLGPVEVTPASG